MNDLWLRLKSDPVLVLLASTNEAVRYFAQKDLIRRPAGPAGALWELPEPKRLLKGQNRDGSWGGANKNPALFPPHHDRLVGTFKRVRLLVEQYGFTRENPALAGAAEYLFTRQTGEGDIRGFIGNQYAAYYTGYVLSLLTRAGYGEDKRVVRGLEWLLTMRQADGGWTIPILTHRYDRRTWLEWTSADVPPVAPDRSRPFSHNWTDMVLRAFAAHPAYRNEPDVKAAAALLKGSFFRPDAYTSMQSARYWTRFRFWWPNLLTALEILQELGFSQDDPDIQQGLRWFIDNQEQDGLWALETGKPVKEKAQAEREWVGLRVGRVLAGFGV